VLGETVAIRSTPGLANPHPSPLISNVAYSGYQLLGTRLCAKNFLLFVFLLDWLGFINDDYSA